MEVGLKLLADCANITAEGKLNVMGIFGEINAPHLPFGLPTFSLVLSFTASPAEIGLEKQLRVILLSQDGNKLLQLDSKTVVPPAPRSGSKSNIVVVLALNNVQFETSGDYQFSILVNEEEKATIPIRVNDRSGGA